MSASFLTQLFPGMRSQMSDSDVNASLRAENTSLKSQLAIARATILGYQQSTILLHSTLKAVSVDLEGIHARSLSREISLADASDEQMVYTLVTRIQPSRDLGNSSGRAITKRVLSIMNEHFWMMVQKALSRADHMHSIEEIKHQPEFHDYVKVILGNLLLWVFGIFIPNQSRFRLPENGILLEEEVDAFIRAAMYTRSFAHGQFTLDLLHTMVNHWRSFSIEQIGLFPLPLQLQLGLPASNVNPLKPVPYPDNIECEFYTSVCNQKKKGMGFSRSVTVRLTPKATTTQPALSQLTAPVAAAAAVTAPSVATSSPSPSRSLSVCASAASSAC